jgi:PAS domain S-box-containing protein
MSKPISVLLVNDNPSSSQVISDQLSSEGFAVIDTAESGDDAIELAGRYRPELILMDADIKGSLSGIESAHHLRQQFDIPIILMTAFEEDAISEGASEQEKETFWYIRKPFQKNELTRNVKMLLQRHKLERTLKASEKWFSTTLKSIGDAVICTDEKGYVTFMNPIAESLCGWKIKEALQKPINGIFNIIDPVSGHPLGSPLFGVLEHGSTSEHPRDITLVTRHNSEVPINHSGAPIRDKDGRVIGMIILFRDNTAHKLAEQTLQEAKAKAEDIISGLFKYLQDGVLILDEKNHVVQMNKSAREFLESIHLDKNEGFLQEVFSGLDLTRDNQTFETFYAMGDSLVHFFVTLTPVQHPKASVSKMIIFKNITANKQSEEALKESEQRFQRLSDASFEGIVISHEGVILDFNQQLCDLFGYRRDELTGMSMSNIVVSEDLDFVLDKMKNKTSDSYEYKCKRKDNTIFTVEVSGNTVNFGGKQVRMSAVRDISDRKTYEQSLKKEKKIAENSNRLKSEFLATMSHELRTPLNAIIGFSEVLKEQIFGPMNAKQKPYIHEVWKSGKHLLTLVNDILDLSKVESGKMELHKTLFSLEEIVDDCLKMTEEEARSRSLSIGSSVAKKIPHLYADKVRIKQALFNLLSNAMKFTPDGGEIDIKAEFSKQGELTCTVTDNGIGIEPEDRAKVFTQFEQIKGDYARPYEGTGLGMPLTKRLIELHGGKIWFSSLGKNKGSQFMFLIPPEQEQKG